MTEAERRKARERYQRRKEIHLRAVRKWQAKNPEKFKASLRNWEANNPLKVRAKRHRRRALETGAVGHYTERQLQARIDFYGRRCYLCGCDWDTLSSWDKTIEHVIPLSQGGTNWPANLRPACRACNQRKGITPLYRARTSS
jgi:5-methylcytosine-specific restriction endonuclease McrA